MVEAGPHRLRQAAWRAPLACREARVGEVGGWVGGWASIGGFLPLRSAPRWPAYEQRRSTLCAQQPRQPQQPRVCAAAPGRRRRTCGGVEDGGLKVPALGARALLLAVPAGTVPELVLPRLLGPPLQDGWRRGAALAGGGSAGGRVPTAAAGRAPVQLQRPFTHCQRLPCLPCLPCLRSHADWPPHTHRDALLRSPEESDRAITQDHAVAHDPRHRHGAGGPPLRAGPRHQLRVGLRRRGGQGRMSRRRSREKLGGRRLQARAPSPGQRMRSQHAAGRGVS